jgi:aminotransferase
LQIGVAEGIRQLPESFYRNITTEYVSKRDLLCGTLREAGLTPSIPNGAYYVLSDASILPGKTSREKALHLLHETGVASVAGSAFYHGEGGENLIRFCFAKNDADLAEACRRLRTLPEKLRTGSLAANTRK